MNIKNENGVSVVDIVIAIGIFIVFTSLIIMLSYNIYLQSNFIKRNDTATNYIVDLFEYARALEWTENFDLQSELEAYINSKEGISISDTVGRGYNMQIQVTTIEAGYVEQVDATVSYKLGKNIKSVTMSTLISK